MNDGEPPEKESPIVARPNPSAITAENSDAASSAQAEIRKELGEFERVSITIQRRMFWVAVLVALITGVYVVITYRQLNVMRDQLAEMKGGSADTHNLAVATGSYAADMKRLAEQTTSLAEQTTSLATSADKSATAAELSRKATERLAGATARAAVASRALAAAANDANAVSRELVKTTQQASEINRNAQRAFVLVKGVTLQKISVAEFYNAMADSNGLKIEGLNPETGKKPIAWRVNLIWENSGNTPTNNLTISGNCWLDWYHKAEHPFEISSIPPDDKFLMKFPEQSALVGPKQSVPVTGCFVDPMSLMFGAFGMTPESYVWGTATYRDILNPSRIHKVDYCFFIHLTGNFETGWYPDVKEFDGPLTADLMPCAKHNCADEECDKQNEGQPKK